MNPSFNLLFAIKKNPVVFLGKKSLERLKAFWDGYTLHMIYKNDESNKYFAVNFQKFVENKHSYSGSYYSWSSIIIQNSSNDEDAFDNFYKLLDEFLVENGKIPFSDERAKDIYVFPYWMNQSDNGSIEG